MIFKYNNSNKKFSLLFNLILMMYCNTEGVNNNNKINIFDMLIQCQSKNIN